MERDLIGYGADVPSAGWPDGARLALQFVINYEEGGERSVLYGDELSESFLGEFSGVAPVAGARNMSVESMFEYGSRAGFWRLLRLFERYDVPVTVFGVADALARNPDAVRAMLDRGWEIACHGLRWLDYQNVDADTERAHISQAIEKHTQATGSRPLGWYTGRTSPNTRLLVAEVGGFEYESDSYNDDLPYWCYEFAEPLLIIPYTLDANDMRFATQPGFGTGDDFFAYLKDSFDVLYEEGADHPRLMSVGLHCRLAGRPGRAAAVARFIEYVNRFERVWCARRIDIARHWREQHPPHGRSQAG